MLDIKQKLAQMMERLKMYSDAILQYESLIGFYIGQLDDVSYSFGSTPCLDRRFQPHPPFRLPESEAV